MPATETTWRNQALLHRIFAVSGVLLTLTTIWMFYADHERSWKDYQVQTLHIDQAMNVMRQEEVESSAAYAEHEKYDADLDRASSAAIPEAPVKEFFKQLDGYAAKQGRTISTKRLATRLENANKQAEKALLAQQAANEAVKAVEAKPDDAELQQAAKKAATEARRAVQLAKDGRANCLDELRGYMNQARIDEEKALNYRKVQNGELDAAKAKVDLAIGDDLSPKEIARLQKVVDDLMGDPDPNNPTGWHKLNQDYQQLGTYRREMEKALKQITAEEDLARKKAEDARAELARLQTAYVEKRETWAQGDRYPWIFGKKWLTFPILDAFGTPRKIDNLWSKDNEQNYNFSYVRRFDRCTTCHQSLAKALPGEAASPAYEKGRNIELVIVPPAKEELPKPQLDDQGNPKPLTLEELLGIRLASEGLLDVDDVTVKYVRPKSPAASARPVSELDEAKKVLGEQIRLATATYHAPPDIEQSFFPTRPGMMLGDVIVAINGDDVIGDLRSPRRVSAMLTLMATQGKPIQVTVRRGFPHPFTSHPRLDLYVSDASPHKMGTFACTICHDGQGSATDFEWASHTPNTTDDAREWMRDYGWFDNPHWIYPMYPKRFAESACLKCHHEVVELEPSQRFPDAPAPKVTHGFHLVRKYGCFGCHEVNGFDGPLKRVGPDLRLEPNYFAVAQELVRNLDLDNREAAFQKLLDEQLEAKVGDKTARQLQQELQAAAGRRLEAEEKKKQLTMAMPPAGEQEIQPLDQAIAEATEVEKTITEALAEILPKLKAIEAHLNQLAQSRQLAFRLTHHPEDTVARNELRSLLLEDQTDTQGQFGQTFTSSEHRLANMLKDIEVPGTLRKAGPSLRYLGDKLDTTFLYDWIENPKHFRPTTRMPRFFGLWDHLKDEHGKLAAGEVAPKLEPVEIRGLIAYLAAYDQPMPLSDEERQQFGQAVAAGNAEHGKRQFEIRGCLACHTHKDFPHTTAFRNPEDIVQGPDLSAIASKFDAGRNPQGPVWLYAWIKEPTRYHARTMMPNLFLEPEKAADGTQTDPAADIAAYLLSDASASKWKPAAAAAKGVDQNQLRDLTLQHLKELFFEEQAEKYLNEGIPPSMEAELKGAEVELVQRPGADLTDQQLRYIGRKTIAKYGCFGCHDIPGFEDAKPIGTGLADWGRKDPARMAFEHITHYLEHPGGGHGPGPAAGESSAKAAPENAVDVEYYLHQVQAASRIGFIYQKLTEPRSYDFKKTENKRYNERLRMPQFPFSLEEREAIITFVLGLVAEPPREKYLYRPDERQRAIIQGKQVLEKYNCGGCHVLEGEKWKIRYSPGAFGPQDVTETFPYLMPHFSPDALQKSAESDSGGKLVAELRVLPSLNARDGLPVVLDESDGTELDNALDYPPSAVKYFVDLYQPTLLDGGVYLTGQKAIQVSVRDVVSRHPTTGGLLTRYLLPRVTALEKEANPQAKGSEAWGWLPPPLLNEGKKVQSQWLHDFLLEPYAIRPAVFLRMPKFNMTSAEATALVNYFSAVDNADYPYEFAPSRQEPQLAAKETAYRTRPDVQTSAADRQRAGSWRFEDAMKIVVNKNYCTQCHKVGDYVPQGSVRAMAPNLADVYRRLRPEYTRHWIANPAMILPYTPMPVNVKYVSTAPNKGGIAQDLYHGTSLEQVEALVDLLMNYDQFARENTSIKALVPAAEPAAPGAAGPTN